MGKVVLGAIAPAGATLATSNFAFAGSVDLSATATEANAQAVCRVAGTFSKLAININATGTSRVYRFRVNGANGNQSVTATDTTAGVYADNSNTDTLSAGDKFNYSTSSTGSPSAFWMRTVFEPTSGQANYYQKRPSNFSGVATVYGALCGGSEALNTTEANTQCKVRTAGTLRYLQVYISSNSRTASSVYKTRKNGANGNSSITITSGSTGLFEDTSNTDTVATGDLVNYALAPGGTGNIQAQFIGSWIISDTDGQSDYFATANGTTRAASGTASYHPFTGTTASSATEANASIQHGFSARASRLRLYLSANTYSTDATATFRVAAADGNQTITLTAGATGWFEDTTHTDDFTANQDCCVKIVGGTSGSITIRTIGLTEEPSTTAYTLTAAQGSFTLTGQTAALSRTRSLAASQGSFTLTGQETTLKRALKVTAGQGSFTLTGQAAALRRGYGVTAAYGAFTLTGQAAAFRRTYRVTATYGAFTLTGQAVAFKRGLKVAAAYGAFTLSGQAASLNRGRKVTAAYGAFTLTGQAVTFARTRAIAAGYGSFTLTGQDASSRRGYVFSLGYGAFTLTGIAAALRRSRLGKSSAVSVTFSGQSASRTSAYVGKTSAVETAFTGKTSEIS